MQNTFTMKLLASAILTLASANIFAQEESELPKRGDTKQFEEFAQPDAAPTQPERPETEQDSTASQSGPMTLEKLTAIIQQVGNNVEVQDGTVAFTFADAQLLAVVAEPANRMRLLAPVIAASELSEAQMAATLVSNYHLALDARYAVGDGVLYSAFIHPLKELTVEQLVSAIRQVANLRNTFGTTYSSGEMSFGVQQSQETIDI